MTQGKYKLLLFDLDGVIVDSRKNMEVSWSAVQAVFEISTPFEKYFEFVGIPFEDIMSNLGLSSLAPRIKMVYDVASSCRIDLIRAYPGCAEGVKTLRRFGIRTGLVTSKDEKRTLEIVKKLELLFDVIECPDGKSRGKPNPDPILRAILKCQIDPKEAIYVGDMQVDEEAARRAGVSYVHASWGYGKSTREAQCAQNFQELLSLFDLSRGSKSGD